MHANAAVGDEAADRARVIGAVNRVFPTAAERQGGRPHGIARAAAWNDIRQRGLIVLDLGRRRPCRAQLLACDEGRPGPLLAAAADADRIAHSLAISEDVIERPLGSLHHDRAARIITRKADDFACLRQSSAIAGALVQWKVGAQSKRVFSSRRACHGPVV